MAQPLIATDISSQALRAQRESREEYAAVWHEIAMPFDSIFYVSGPSVMLQAISADLRERGVRTVAIKVDAWE